MAHTCTHARTPQEEINCHDVNYTLCLLHKCILTVQRFCYGTNSQITALVTHADLKRETDMVLKLIY